MPGRHADKFEAVALEQVYKEGMKAAKAEAEVKGLKDGPSKALARDCAHYALMGKTTMFSPKLLKDASAPPVPWGFFCACLSLLPAAYAPSAHALHARCRLPCVRSASSE